VDGDLVFFGADRAGWSTMPSARCASDRPREGHGPAGWAPLWVVDFPMFEYDEDDEALERAAPSLHRAEGR
jgi:aspartyl-tRNA synthetase